MRTDDLKKKGTKAFMWDFSGRIVTRSFSLIVSIYLTRILEPSDFGLMAIIMVLVGITSLFTDSGLNSALIQRKRLHPVHYSSVFYFNLFIGFILSITTYLLAPYISSFFGHEMLLPMVQAISLLFIINSLYNVQIIKLQRELNFSVLVKISLLSAFVGGAVGIVIAHLGYGVWSLVIQLLLSALTTSILLLVITRWLPGLIFSWKSLKHLWGYGFRIFLSSLLATIFNHLDSLIIGKLFATVTLGYFDRAKSLNTMASKITSESLMSILFPVLSKIKNNLPRFQNIILRSLRIISFVTFLISGLLYVTSEDLIILLFSSKWEDSVFFFKIIVLSSFSLPISVLLVNILTSRGKSKDFLRLEIYKKIVISINFYILYKYGIEYYLYGLIVTSFFSLSLNAYFSSREIMLSPLTFGKEIIIYASISILSAIACILIYLELPIDNIMLSFLLKMITFVLIYTVINHIFKTKGILIFYKNIQLFYSTIRSK